MTDTAVTRTNQTAATPETSTTPNEGFFLDGDAPRLGSAPIAAPAPLGDGAAAPTTQPSEPEPTRVASQLADMDPASMPTLPSLAPPPPAATETAPAETGATDTDPSGPPDDQGTEVSADHPMAHLMPPKSKPSEASVRAARIRAEKKAKARKVKIGAAIGALVVAVLVGPPLFSWLSDAIDDAGGTTSEPTD